MIFLHSNCPALLSFAQPGSNSGTHRGSDRSSDRPALRLSAALLLVAGALFSGCGKSDAPQTSTKSATTQPSAETLLSHVPKNSWGFMRANLNNPEVQKILAKNLKKFDTTQALSALEQQTSISNEEKEKYKASMKLVFSLYEIFLDEGIFPSEKGQGTIEEAVGEVHYIPDTKKFEGGIIFRSKIPGEALLTQLESALKRHQVESEKKSASELVLTLDGTKVHATSSANLISVSQSPESSKALLATVPEKAPIITEAEAKIPGMTNEWFVLYSGLKTLVQGLEANEELKKDFPLESVQFATSVDGGLVRSHGAVNFNSANATASAVLKELSETKSAEGGVFPRGKDVAFAFQISDGAIKTLISNLAKSPDAAGSAEFGAILPLLNQIGSLGVGVVQGGVASPYPEMYLSSRTPAGTSLKTSLKELITPMLAPMLGGVNWQEKKVGETSADVITSPFGVGLFLAATKDELVLSTGEASLTLNTTEATEPAVADTNLLAKVKSLAGAPIVTFYTDGGKLAQIVKDINSIAATFTGGKSVVDQATLTQLQAQKESFATVSAFPDKIELRGWSVVPQ